jgi:hypothetical protein
MTTKVRVLNEEELKSVVGTYIEIPGVGPKLAEDVTVDEWRLVIADLRRQEDELDRQRKEMQHLGKVLGLVPQRVEGKSKWQTHFKARERGEGGER